MEISPDLIVPDQNISIAAGAIKPWKDVTGTWYSHILQTLAEKYSFDLFTPWYKLPEKAKQTLLFGSGKEEIKFKYSNRNGKFSGEYTGKFEGVINNLKRRYKETSSSDIRSWIESFMNVSQCHVCEGTRLRPESRSVKIHNKTISDITAMSVKDSFNFFDKIKLDKKSFIISEQLIKEIKERLNFMINVGLDYLTLERTANTLSGGESQRIRLATQIGSQLVGVLYILDEPSIGLHHRDNKRLIDTLVKLKDLGNTVLVVEHDRDTIESSDWIIDLGPGAGNYGGEIVCQGNLVSIKKCRKSLTAQYLSRKKCIPVPESRKAGNGKSMILRGARGNNLKNIDVRFPLGCFTAITGVSGSGKSTLINETLYKVLAKNFYSSRTPSLPYNTIEGLESIDKVIEIDQSPIGRTPRSNPATYTGLLTYIRDLFTKLPEAKMRGYKPGRFSFNVKGGRCESCEGGGIIKIEMHFLPDVYITCEVCKGKRYNRETLEIKYRGKSIADILDMTVSEALKFFDKHPAIKRKLQTLYDVGLGYIKLGQQATTLSGGEAQRVKLSTELSKIGTGNTLYILDEPTTGLHFEDVNMLLEVLQRLVSKGNTVLVIEHNLDVIKTADHIIDLGPEGGDKGGYLVAEGTPEEVSKNSKSYTGRFLREELKFN
jgi:excinuclease ABC subunit A